MVRMGVRVKNVKQFFDFFEKFLDVLGVHGLRLVLEVVNDDEAFQQGVVGLAAKGRGHRGNGRGVMQDAGCRGIGLLAKFSRWGYSSAFFAGAANWTPSPHLCCPTLLTDCVSTCCASAIALHYAYSLKLCLVLDLAELAINDDVVCVKKGVNRLMVNPKTMFDDSLRLIVERLDFVNGHGDGDG